MKYSYAKAGRTLYRTAAQMYYGNSYRPSNLQIGDLLFYAPTKLNAGKIGLDRWLIPDIRNFAAKEKEYIAHKIKHTG